MYPSQILSSGNPVQVDLLTEVPSSTDVLTWKKPFWEGYQSQQCIPKINFISSEIIGGEIKPKFFVDFLLIGSIVAIGVSFEGQSVFMAPVTPLGNTLSQIPDGSMLILFLCQPFAIS